MMCFGDGGSPGKHVNIILGLLEIAIELGYLAT